MGNVFSGHFTHYRPPTSRRIRRRSQRLSVTVNSSTPVNAENTTTTKPSQFTDQPQTTDSASSLEQSRKQSANGNSTNAEAPAPKRKPSVKMSLKKAYTSTSPNVFTEERRQLVFLTWQHITNKLGKVETAGKIFQNLFQESAAIRDMFGVSTTDDADNGASFTRHVHVFANVLDLAVRNVLDLEAEIGPLLIMFGRRHFHKHRVDFRHEYLVLFGQSISDVVHANLSETFAGNPEVMAGWRLFISYLIKKVKEGYDTEAVHQQHSRK